MSGVSSHETDLLAEEGTGAEDALLHYCKPVEFYNVLKHRAGNNPYFLQRSLTYKREAEPVNRLRAGNVIFCYEAANKTEVTENFTCSICLTKCGSFKGLRLHLTSSHDFFNFEFKESEETRVVNVSVKPNTWSNKIIGAGDDPIQTYIFWSKSQHPELPGSSNELQANTDDSLARLQKRQFCHSHGAKMEMEEVLADRDSEDEADGDVANIEDKIMIDDFVDVTKDEKKIMHLWNCFVRKQRVLVDCHVPWACEAFSKLHGKDLVQNPGLLGCWKLFMVKLWNHRLLDPSTMNKCNLILEITERRQRCMKACWPVAAIRTCQMEMEEVLADRHIDEDEGDCDVADIEDKIE